ncbi:MAG: DegT/DnrJ/EryC1/StrS family aminotransferase [Crocinitomicaceae bacterium]|nr:MAG: DegT/DnrJ/EryC1/StrS family aminotransferase [Crocinitomicaceae bacterium]
MIPVTKSFIPPLDEYTFHVKRAFDNGWLTNRGPLVLELEEKLSSRLEVSQLTLMTNGTIPLQIAVKLLGNGGEIITTPFSYVATTSSIVWEGCTPVFVDIHPEYLTIDETKIEAAITDRTTCILATHVFGNPCHVEEIERIARTHKLHVIYDGAHSFGVTYRGKSIFGYGTISTCSFHATKLFHCGEGGATFCNDEKLAHRVFYSHNFGHNGPEAFFDVGINGKMSEMQAAMGLSVLPYMDEILAARKQIVEFYEQNLDWSRLKTIRIRENTDWNYSYFPVIFESEDVLLKVVKKLNEQAVFPRRYFYPSLNTLNYVNDGNVNHSENIASRVLCLPLFHGLEDKVVLDICKLINHTI